MSPLQIYAFMDMSQKQIKQIYNVQKLSTIGATASKI